MSEIPKPQPDESIQEYGRRLQEARGQRKPAQRKPAQRKRQAPAATTDERVQRAARLRTARAFAGLTQEELVTKLADRGSTFTAPQIKQYENAQRAISLDVLYAVGEACAVPRWFMEHGFDPPGADHTVTLMRLAATQSAVEHVGATLGPLLGALGLDPDQKANP